MSTQGPPRSDTPDKAALEEDIESTREQLVDAVDALAERVDPRQVGERTAEQLKRDTQRAADTARARAETAQQRAQAFLEENPEEAKTYARIAVGVVLVWLTLRWRRRRRR